MTLLLFLVHAIAASLINPFSAPLSSSSSSSTSSNSNGNQLEKPPSELSVFNPQEGKFELNDASLLQQLQTTALRVLFYKWPVCVEKLHERFHGILEFPVIPLPYTLDNTQLENVALMHQHSNGDAFLQDFLDKLSPASALIYPLVDLLDKHNYQGIPKILEKRPAPAWGKTDNLILRTSFCKQSSASRLVKLIEKYPQVARFVRPASQVDFECLYELAIKTLRKPLISRKILFIAASDYYLDLITPSTNASFSIFLSYEQIFQECKESYDWLRENRQKAIEKISNNRLMQSFKIYRPMLVIAALYSLEVAVAVMKISKLTISTEDIYIASLGDDEGLFREVLYKAAQQADFRLTRKFYALVKQLQNQRFAELLQEILSK